ncbi:DHS-like NAD/FAD-binding domain-containing protein [Pterulicium gracile]|uniref:DHS-like NAD/FAD-binding domain-containing protein n=1 Tax=Pterulicium gracile TaxID=1884261 RepID=A0A5C3QXT6_9AGAR|nr:DHS-like NAD/FAD-binding domain-containing protein [Pterula gracilis]
MRVSVPSIPHVVLPNRPRIPPAEAIERLTNFLRPTKNVSVLTGAGVSVDSGIRAYRGKDGRYMNPNYQPIFYHELMDRTEKGFKFRQRYWLRSYLGYPPIRDAQPNRTHYAIAALQYSGNVSQLITQNVDALHNKAASSFWSDSEIARHILQLHGTLHRVRCSSGHKVDRETFQEMLSISNPYWKQFVDDMDERGEKPRTNPDGDVALEGVSYDEYKVPSCPECHDEGRGNSAFKPEVVFFGESIPELDRDASFKHVDSSDRLLVIGTTLATYSAFRLVKRALEQRKPVLVLNVGPTRADDLPGLEKIEVPTSLVLREVVRELTGQKAAEDPVLAQLLNSGVYMPPFDYEEYRDESGIEPGEVVTPTTSTVGV